MKTRLLFLLLISLKFSYAENFLYKYKLVSFIEQEANPMITALLGGSEVNLDETFFYVYKNKDTSFLIASQSKVINNLGTDILALRIGDKFYKKTKEGLVLLKFRKNNTNSFQDENGLNIKTDINSNYLNINSRSCLLLLCPLKIETNSYCYKLVSKTEGFINSPQFLLKDSISVSVVVKNFCVEKYENSLKVSGLSSGKKIYILLPSVTVVNHIANKDETSLIGLLEKDLFELKFKKHEIEIVTDDKLNETEVSFLHKNFNSKYVNVDNNFMINLLCEASLEAKVIITDINDKVLLIKDYLEVIMEEKNLNDLILEANKKKVI